MTNDSISWEESYNALQVLVSIYLKLRLRILASMGTWID